MKAPPSHPGRLLLRPGEFPLFVNRLRSLDPNGFDPRQPLSKLEPSLASLQKDFTLFTIQLLDPSFIGKGVMVVPTSRAAEEPQTTLRAGSRASPPARSQVDKDRRFLGDDRMPVRAS